ncbi:hypothetical protein C5C00_12950 [Rathayibacter rathayi]|nr:hypothetical protein C5C47_13375 [Rathayibacter rathayi]PPG94001.1 hypothetical protein C5C00_12950 [Rathayibacter rathayi]
MRTTRRDCGTWPPSSAVGMRSAPSFSGSPSRHPRSTGPRCRPGTGAGDRDRDGTRRYRPPRPLRAMCGADHTPFRLIKRSRAANAPPCFSERRASPGGCATGSGHRKGENMKMLKPSGGARREWVDFAKGAAILLVVYYHTSLYLGDIGVENTLGRIKIVFELFPMPLFFLVSGLFGSRITSWSFRDLWRRRLYPLLWLYVIWSLLRMVFYVIVPLANGGLGELPATDPLNLLLLFFWPSSSYWFIYGLFLFTLGAWLLRRVDHRVQVALAAILGTMFTTGLVNTTNVGWNRIGALFVFYLVGTLYSKRIIDVVEKNSARGFLYVTPVFILLSTVLFLFPIRWVPFLALAGQMAAVAMGVLVARALSRVRVLNFVTVCGERSLHIYLLHLYVIVLCVTALRFLLPADRSVIAGFEIPLLLVVLAIAVVLSIVVTRYLSKIRWIYVPPAALGGPGRKRKPVAVPARGAGVTADPAAVPADEPGTSPSYQQKKAESHE